MARDFTDIYDLLETYPNIIVEADSYTTDPAEMLCEMQYQNDYVSPSNNYYQFNSTGKVRVEGHDSMFHLTDSDKPHVCAYVDEFAVSTVDGYEPTNIKGRINLNIIGISYTSNVSWTGTEQNTTGIKPREFSSGFNTAGGMRFSIDAGLFGRLGCVVEDVKVPFRYTFNIPIYATREEAEEYYNYGRVGNPLNKPFSLDEVEDTTVRYYISSHAYRTDKNKENKTVVPNSYHYDEFVVPRTIAIEGYVTDGDPYNIKLVYHNTKYTEGTIDPNTPIKWRSELLGSWSTIPISNILNSTTYKHTARTVIEKSYGYLYGSISTNIPIKDSKYAAEHGTGEDLNNIKPIKGTTSWKTGDDDEQNSKVVDTTISYDGFCNQYIGSFELVKALLRWGSEQEIENATSLYANTIDAVIDCYVLPFDPSPFMGIESSNEIVLGKQAFNISIAGKSIRKITSFGKVVTLVNSPINEIFGDFRDYSLVNAHLYLFGVGIMPFDYKTWLGTNLIIKATLDTRAHTIKYFLFSDDKLIQTIDATIGMDVVITGSDNAQRLSALKQATTDMAGGILNMGISVATANPIGLASNLFSTAKSFNESSNIKGEKPNIISSGTVSSGCDFSAPMYPYIIFEIQQSEIPSNLHDIYGYPANYYGRLGECSGYTIIDDIRLVSSATEREKERIKALLSEGIIM